MRLALLMLAGSVLLSGCCAELKESIRGYGEAAAASAETRSELIARCKTAGTETDAAKKQSALEACDAAIAAEDAARKSALELTKK